MVADLPLGLKAMPFADEPDPSLFVQTEPHRRALAHIRYGLRHAAGIVVMTGDEGTGKTMVLSCFGAMGETADRRLVLLPVPVPSEALGDVLLSRLQEEDVAAGEQDLKTALRRLSDAGTPVALFVDDAHELAARHFDDLLAISSLSVDGMALVQITLSGRPQLRTVLYDQEREAFRRRIVATYHLPALTKNDVAIYVHQRLALAGAGPEVTFAREATDRLAAAADGLPARLNPLARHALARAAADGRLEVTSRDIRAAEDGTGPFAIVKDAEVRREPVPNGDGIVDVADEQARERAASDADVDPVDTPVGQSTDHRASEPPPLPMSIHGLARVDDRLAGKRPPPVSVRELNAAIEKMSGDPPETQPKRRRRFISPQEMMERQSEASLSPGATIDLRAPKKTAGTKPAGIPMTEAEALEALEAFVEAASGRAQHLSATVQRMRSQVERLRHRRESLREKIGERIESLEETMTNLLRNE